ncbi:hypothetical protein EBZ80_22575 [bacterium]|nr:hypothetical protein [bacterium]
MATFANIASNVGNSPFSATLTNSINSAVRGGEAETLGANISQLGCLLRQFDADNLDGAGFESNTATKAKYFLSGNVIDPSSGYLQILGSNLPVYDPVSGSYGDPATNFRITSIEYRNSFLNNIRFIVAGTFSTTTTTITSIETGDDFLSVKVSGSISLDNIAGNVSSASLSNIAISFLDDDGIAVTATLGVSLSLTNKSLTVNSLAISKGSQSLFAAQNLGLLYSLDARDNPFSVGSVSANGLSRDLLFSANDIIVGTSGTDSLDGYGGNDSINAGSGRDWIAGGVGNDTLLGVAGSDTLYGGSGNDNLSGGTESDFLYGDEDRDTLSGDAGNDLLCGGLGRDLLMGGVGSDTLAGGDVYSDRFGIYVINPGENGDTLNGGAGDDTYVIDNAAITIVESAGYDTGVVAAEGLVANVGGLAQIEKFVINEDFAYRHFTSELDTTLQFTANALNNVVLGSFLDENLNGGNGNDILRGNDGNDTLIGGLGNDALFGGYGDDILNAGDGNDTLNGEAGVNVMNGGGGNDTYIVDMGEITNDNAYYNYQKTTIEDPSGTDILRFVLARTEYGYENGLIRINDGKDLAFCYSENPSDIGSELLARYQNSDGSFNLDALVANGSHFFILKNQYLKNGQGIYSVGLDTLVGKSSDGAININFNLADFSLVNNFIQGTSAADLMVSAGENLKGLSGNDNLQAENLIVSVVLDGGDGNDNLLGGDRGDTLIGGKGADTIDGGRNGGNTFMFAAGDSGQTAGFDIIDYLVVGDVGTGDLIDYSVNLTRGGNANAATSSQASINQSTGIANFASGSGTTLTDALGDIASRLNTATDAAGEFALFQINRTGDFYLFISDGSAGVGANDVVIQLVGITTVSRINLSSGNLTILG